MVVGETAVSRRILACVREARPDLLVLQADLEGVNVASIIIGCRALRPQTKVLVLEGRRLVSPVKEFYMVKPDAYVHHRMGLEELLEKALLVCCVEPTAL